MIFTSYPLDAPTIIPDEDIDQTLVHIPNNVTSTERKRNLTKKEMNNEPNVVHEEIKKLEDSSRKMAWRKYRDQLGLNYHASAASNNWAISGNHTATGFPLLSNDPHLSYSVSIWEIEV